MAEHNALPGIANDMPPDLPEEHAMLFQIITQCWPLPAVAAACLAQWEASQAAKWAAQAPPAQRDAACAGAKLAAERARQNREAAELLAAPPTAEEVAALVRKMGGKGWRTYEQFVRSAPLALYKNFSRWPGGWPAWLADTVAECIRPLPELRSGVGTLVELDFRKFSFETLTDQLKQPNSALHLCVREDARDKCAGRVHIVGVRLPRCGARDALGAKRRERSERERIIKAVLLTYKDDLLGERLPAGLARGWIDLEPGDMPDEVSAVREVFAELQLEPGQWPHVLVDGRDPEALNEFDTRTAAARKAAAIAARNARLTQQA